MSVLTVYKASAGSGKTFRLAVEYIKLLVEADDGGAYRHILAVTFTNKATTEMKDRILRELYGIGHGLQDSEAYYAALCEGLAEDGRDDLGEREIRRRCRSALDEILHDYSRFRVSTIDTFFQSVLRGLAHELGLTANLQVEISDNEVLSRAVDRIIDGLEQDTPLLDWVFSLVSDQIEQNQQWNVTRQVKRFGRAIFNERYLLDGDRLRAVVGDAQRFEHINQTIVDERNSAVAAVKASGQQLEEALSDAGVAAVDFSNGRDLVSLIGKLKSGSMDVVIGSRLLTWIEDSESLVRKTDRSAKPHLLSAAASVSSALGDVVERYLGCQHRYNSAQLVLSHLKTLRLLDAIDREVASLNAETSRFNLAKTPILLNRMIGESDAPFVFEKMGALLRHVMIDEFQDTSSLQWKNFRALLLESFAKGGRNLIVGDVKQSIYRWRGGDWRVLGHIDRSFSPEPRIVPLKYNRRSRYEVVTFNNGFFRDASRLLDQVCGDDASTLPEAFSFVDAYSDVEQLLPDGRGRDGYVRAVTYDTKELSSNDAWRSASIEDMISQIRQLHAAGLPYEQMAILVRFNKEARPIIDAFSREADLPAIVSDEAFLLSSSPAIRQLIAALRALDDDSDQVASYYVKDLGCGDLLIDASLRTLPLYELLEELCRRLRLKDIPHQDAYLFAFFDAAVDFLHNKSADIHSFLRYWDETLSGMSIPAGRVDGIRILTIHKSKGLEYHTVFLPFCAWNFESRHADNLVWCEPDEAPYDEFGLLPVTPSAKMTNSAFAEDATREHLFSRLDELNGLYVAFTRARSNLYIWSAGRPDALTKKSYTIGDLVAAVLPEGAECGEPVVTIKGEERSDNPMSPSRRGEHVTMHSYALNAVFRQSNRSRQFVQSLVTDDDEMAMSEQARQQQYIETGKLLHGVLQQIRTTADIPRVLNALEQDGVISRHAVDGTYVAVGRTDLERWIDRGLRNPVVAQWFDGSWDIFNECSIVRKHPDTGQPQTLRPDRVMLSHDGQRIVVVDFKFGAPHEDYVDQVRLYMELLQAMYPQAVVTGHLWFVYSGRVQDVSLSRSKSKPSRRHSTPDPSQLTFDL